MSPRDLPKSIRLSVERSIGPFEIDRVHCPAAAGLLTAKLRASGGHYYLKAANDTAPVAEKPQSDVRLALACEFEGVGVLHAADLGPRPIASGDAYYLREFVSGRSLGRHLADLPPAEQLPLLSTTVAFLCRITQVAGQHPRAGAIAPTLDHLILKADDTLAQIGSASGPWRWRADWALGFNCGRCLAGLMALVPFEAGVLDRILEEFSAQCTSEAIAEAALHTLDLDFRSSPLTPVDDEVTFLQHCAESSILSQFRNRSPVSLGSQSAVRVFLDDLKRSEAAFTLGREYDLETGDGTFRPRDLDLFVRQEDLDFVRSVLWRHGFSALSANEYFRYCAPDRRLVYVDLHSGALSVAGSAYLDLDRIVATRTWKHGFPVPNPRDIFLFMLLQPVFRKSDYKPQYWTRLQDRSRDADLVGRVKTELDGLVGPNASTTLLGHVAGGTQDSLCAMRTRLITKLAGKPPAAGERLRHAWYRVNSAERRGVLHPAARPLVWMAQWAVRRLAARGRRNRLVAFVGADGAGKSTMIRRLQDVLHTNGLPGLTLYLGGLNLRSRRVNPYLIPYGKPVGFAKFIYTRLIDPPRRGTEEQGSSGAPQPGPRDWYDVPDWFGRSLSLLERLLLPLAVLDSVLYGFLVAIKGRSGRVVLADRFFYDLLLITRSRVVRWCLNRIPRPTVMFHLHHDPAVLLERKNSRQYSSHDLADAQRAYDTLADYINGLVVLPVKTEEIERTEDFLVTQLAARRILWPTEAPLAEREPARAEA
jgi:hypothetical protein